MDILDLGFYNIVFKTENGNDIAGIISLSQPYKKGETISIICKVDERNKNKWRDDLCNKGALYKIVDIYHEITEFYGIDKEVSKNIFITLRKIKDWEYVK